MGLDMYAYKTKEFIDDDQTKIKDEKENTIVFMVGLKKNTFITIQVLKARSTVIGFGFPVRYLMI